MKQPLRGIKICGWKFFSIILLFIFCKSLNNLYFCKKKITMKNPFNILIICNILVTFLLSCKEETTKVAELIVEPKNLTLSKGDVVNLVYVVMPYKADNKSISFKSKDVSVATVSDKGVITAISEGETQIVVTTNEGNVNDEVFVRVLRGSTELDSITLLNLHKKGCIEDSRNWNLTKPMHTWDGVVLSENRRVLSFGTLILQNTLDESLANLAFLQTLSIDGNTDFYFESYFPEEIWMLSELHTLSIRSFYGTIPAEIGNLSNLKNLNIFYSRLIENIPVELGNLTNLKKICFNWNYQLGKIPKEFGKLEELEELTIMRSYLTGNIPKELGNLYNLKHLNLNRNQLTGIIPKELGNLPDLEVLDLGSNQLTGTIPSELGNLSNLKSLSFYNNKLTGSIPKELGNLQKLENLVLNDNNLTGEIPLELANLYNLSKIDVYYNSLSGNIPKELGNLANLEVLNLSSNKLTGTIPSELGNLSNLKSIYFYRNKLTGSIPKELGNLQKLENLVLYDNNLTGEIPQELGNLHNLSELTVFYNSLSGIIPEQLLNKFDILSFCPQNGTNFENLNCNWW